ncbi:YceD family protein [Glaciibacter sp. 2TAF33]|uniref:YceD family protein n=1 Tax=Glaciibacter sp. 2TAF33 TaxID=3233015 RepID=UPI003F9161B2
MTKFNKTPYTIDVRDLINRPGAMLERSLDITVPDDLGEGLVAVKAGSTMETELRLESMHEGILASVDVSARALGVCGRCLIDIDLPVQVEFQELFAYSLDEAFEFEVHDDHVDLEPLIRDAVVLSLPFQPVCRPDCPGLDPETGLRLAAAPESEPEETRDPRWAALAGFQASEDISTDEISTGAVSRAETDREEK